MRFVRLAACAAAFSAMSIAPAAAQGWGALAISENGTEQGRPWAAWKDAGSRELAMRGALGACARHAEDCKVYSTFQNRCIAISGASGGAFGWAMDPSAGKRAELESAAVGQCRQYGGTDCRVFTYFCSGVEEASQPPQKDQPPPSTPPSNQPPPGGQPNPKE
jgi:hypothetical protein